MEKRKIKAVHEYDLEIFLDSIGMLEKITKGEILCTQCGTVIVLENFDSIGKSDGALKVYCAKPECRLVTEE